MIFSAYAINLTSNSSFSLNPSNLTNASTVKRETSIVRVFEISQVPSAFAFESKRPNTNSATKQLPNYRLAVGLTFPHLTNGNSMTVLSPNCHSAKGIRSIQNAQPIVHVNRVFTIFEWYLDELI